MDTTTQQKEQKMVGSTDYGSFKDQLNLDFSEGWRIVPGTIAIAMTPTGLNLTGRERYIAVVEK